MDVGIPKEQFLVSPTKEIEELWKEVKRQELRSKIKRAEQDIEDLIKGRVLDLQAKIKMWNLELDKLNSIEA